MAPVLALTLLLLQAASSQEVTSRSSRFSSQSLARLGRTNHAKFRPKGLDVDMQVAGAEHGTRHRSTSSEREKTLAMYASLDSSSLFSKQKRTTTTTLPNLLPLSTTSSRGRASSSSKLAPPRAIFGGGGKDGPVARLKKVFKDYGAIALVFHASVWTLTLASSYLLVLNDLPIDRYLPESLHSHMPRGGGEFALAYLATEATGPLRTLLTLFAAPLLARRWNAIVMARAGQSSGGGQESIAAAAARQKENAAGVVEGQEN